MFYLVAVVCYMATPEAVACNAVQLESYDTRLECIENINTAKIAAAAALPDKPDFINISCWEK